MQLTEAQLFTVEALNRIDGFVWPDGAEFAELDGGRFAYFYGSDEGIQSAIASKRVKDDNDSRIIYAEVTREQFDSVDGWVRNDGNEPVITGNFDLLISDGEVIDYSGVSVDGWDWSVPCEDGFPITHWRYHKPLNTDLPPTQDVPPVGAPVASPSPTDLVDVALRKYVEARTHTHVLQSALDEAKQQELAALEALNTTMKALNLSVVVNTPEQVTQGENEGELSWANYTWKTEVSYKDNQERLQDFVTSILPTYWPSDVRVLEVYPAYLILLDGKKNKVKVTTRLGQTALHNVVMFAKVE